MTTPIVIIPHDQGDLVMDMVLVLIPHEKIALELCAALVTQGKTFRCAKKPSGWEFEVLS